VTGLPQGGMVSPILAHISLHHVLEVWWTDDVKAHGQGQAIVCRDADDVVCALQDEREAERFSRV
jgi:RNA-directed DNA polymerase